MNIKTQISILNKLIVDINNQNINITSSLESLNILEQQSIQIFIGASIQIELEWIERREFEQSFYKNSCFQPFISIS